jgi:hypothetical protein
MERTFFIFTSHLQGQRGWGNKAESPGLCRGEKKNTILKASNNAVMQDNAIIEERR